MIRLIIILCSISFIFADDGKNNMYDTGYSTDKAVENFPYYRKAVPTMPKIIYLKNLFELNCLKQIMKNSNFKNSSQNQTNKEFNPVLPLQQYFNTTKRMVNPAGNKPNQLANKFLLIPAGRDYNFLSNRKRNNLDMYNLINNQKKLKENDNRVMGPSKPYFKKEIRKDNTIQRTNPQVFPQIGHEEETLSNFKPNVLRLNSSANNKPTLSSNPQSTSRYKSIIAKPQTVHSYEVEEVFQDEEKTDKQNERAWEKIKAFEKIPQKPSLDVNANIFDMISKILQSGTSSKSTPENEGKLFKNDLKANKKSNLDEEIWEGSKSEISNNKNSPESKSPMKPFSRNEYLKENKNFKGNKENKNLNEGYEKPRRNERPNGNQNLAVRPNSGVSTLGTKRISPPLRIQTPVLYKPKLRQYFTTTLPTTITESVRLQNPNILKFFREKQAKLGNENIPPSNDLSRRNYRYPMPRKAEFQNNIRNTSFAGIWQYGRNAQVIPQDAEKIKSSPSNTTTKNFIIKSMKFYSQTTFPNPLPEVTENPSRFEDLSKPTDMPTKKEENLKNGRKMHFIKEKDNTQSQNKKQKIMIDQRRSDIPIEEESDTTNQISAINFLKLNTNDTSKLNFDTISNEFLVTIIPMVIDDLRKNRVSSENTAVFSKIFGKYWPRVKELSKDVNLDMLPLLKIRNKKDFKKFFENLNVTESHLKENNSNDSDNFDDYDYIEEFKEIYKDVLFQELQENTDKMRVKRNSQNDLKDLDETRQLFEQVQEEENEIDYLYEHFYLNKPSGNEGNGNIEDFISMVEYLQN